MSRYLAVIADGDEEKHVEVTSNSQKKARKRVLRAFPKAVIKFLSRLNNETDMPVSAREDDESFKTTTRTVIADRVEDSKSLVPKPKSKTAPVWRRRPALRVVINPTVLAAIGGPKETMEEAKHD